MSRLSPRQKKNLKALLALGHHTTASAIAEIRQSMPNFDKKHNYPKVEGMCPSLADIILHFRGEKVLRFDHETGYVSRNQRRLAALDFSRARGHRHPSHNPVWRICG